MSAKTKTELKAESDSTFTTNGVRAITAASHRTFNDDLIDSLDVVDFVGILKQIKREYVIIKVTQEINLPFEATTFAMSKVKDQLLSNILEFRPCYICLSASDPTPYINNNGSSLFSYRNWFMLDPVNFPGYVVTRTIANSNASDGWYNGLHYGYAVYEITYIPAE